MTQRSMLMLATTMCSKNVRVLALLPAATAACAAVYTGGALEVKRCRYKNTRRPLAATRSPRAPSERRDAPKDTIREFPSRTTAVSRPCMHLVSHRLDATRTSVVVIFWAAFHTRPVATNPRNSSPSTLSQAPLKRENMPSTAAASTCTTLSKLRTTGHRRPSRTCVPARGRCFLATLRSK